MRVGRKSRHIVNTRNASTQLWIPSIQNHSNRVLLFAEELTRKLITHINYKCNANISNSLVTKSHIASNRNYLLIIPSLFILITTWLIILYHSCKTGKSKRKKKKKRRSHSILFNSPNPVKTKRFARYHIFSQLHDLVF